MSDYCFLFPQGFPECNTVWGRLLDPQEFVIAFKMPLCLPGSTGLPLNSPTESCLLQQKGDYLR